MPCRPGKTLVDLWEGRGGGLGCPLTLFVPSVLSSMDGFRLVKLNEVIRQVDIVITCTGQSRRFLQLVEG